MIIIGKTIIPSAGVAINGCGSPVPEWLEILVCALIFLIVIPTIYAVYIAWKDTRIVKRQS